MNAIWKYTLPAAHDCWIDMPEGAKILSVAVQNDEPQVWAIVDTQAPKLKRHFLQYGTGHEWPEIPEPGFRFLGTAVLRNGALVIHVFVEIQP